MKIKYLFILISMIFLTSILSAYSIGFDYVNVRSTSYPTYMPYQYALPNDFIDLRYSVYGQGLNNPLNVVVSPKVYGLTNLGQRVFIHNLPSNSFYLSPSSNYVYSLNPMFSVNPSYQSYEIVLDLQSLDGNYNTKKSSYIYSKEDFYNYEPEVDNSVENKPTCDDFTLSGFSDIYLTEDTTELYDLFVINSTDTPFTITSITTNPSNPEKLNVRNIFSENIINEYLTESIQLELISDTISSNYNDTFDIRVVGNYENLVCEKNYSVNYRINKDLLSNTADCSDIDLSKNNFYIDSGKTQTIDFDLINESLNYYFEVDSIKIETSNDSLIDVSLENNIYDIDYDSKENLELKINSNKSESYFYENITLKIDGYFKRDNREDKKCRLTKDIRIRLAPNDSEDYFNYYPSNNNTSNNISDSVCSDIGFYNSSFNKGLNYITIYNNSDNNFSLNDIIYQNNNLSLEIIDKSLYIPKNSSKLIRVSANDLGYFDLFAKGIFSNGVSCDYLDTTKGSFKSSISLESENACNYDFKYPLSKEISLKQDSINIHFNNLSNKNGTIEIISNGAVIDKPLISFGAYESLTKQINLSNIQNPRNVVYKIKLFGCDTEEFTTNLNYKNTDDPDIYFVSTVSDIKSLENNLLGNLTLKNNNLKEPYKISLKLSGFENNFEFITSDISLNKDDLINTKNKEEFLILNNSSKNIYFGVIVPENAKNILYNGYIDVYYEDKLILQEPFSIDRRNFKEEFLASSIFEKTKENMLSLTMFLENNTTEDKNIKIIFKDINIDDVLISEGNISNNNKLDFNMNSFSKKVINFDFSSEKIDSSSINYVILEVPSNEILIEEELLLKERKNNLFLTGFFSLTSFGDFMFIFLFIVILFIIFMVVYYIIRYYKKQKIRKTYYSNNMHLKKNLTEENENLNKLENKELEELESENSEDYNGSKQVTLQELSKLDKN